MSTEVLFFDTSALVKRYYEEPGTEAVDTLIEDERPVVITSLTGTVPERACDGFTRRTPVRI